MQENVRHDGSPRRLEGWAGSGFRHQKLVAYHVAVELVKEVLRFAGEIPREWRELRVQLVRAALAVPRHIAEAAARTSAADRRARFQVARGECAECDATLDVLAAVTSSAQVEPLQHLAARAGALLSGLILHERRRLAAKAPDAG